MKRYSAYDAQEYIDWQPNPDVQAQFTARAIEGDRGQFIGQLSTDQLLDLYRGLVMARLHDIQLKRWVKQGVITKAWLGSGEEAVTVGTCAALDSGDVVGPMIRNASALIEQGMPLLACFSSYLGTTDNLTGGRDLHIGDLKYGVVPPISHIGDLVPVMAGCALAFKQQKKTSVAMTWTGDGSTATGAVHEGLRMAAATAAPLICIIQNNQVALGTHQDVHSKGTYEALGPAYGMPVVTMDGNHVLDCFAAAQEAVSRCRKGEGPVLMVATTFRMGGHATHDEREARELFGDDIYAFWGQRDPIGMYEVWLQDERGIDITTLEEIEATALQRIESAAKEALSRRESHAPDPETQTDGVYA